MRLFGIFVVALAVGIVLVSSFSSGNKTVDTFDGSSPPWFVWNVLPALYRIRSWLRELEPPFAHIFEASHNLQLPFILEALVAKRVPDLLYERGALSVVEIANVVKADPSMLYRFLRRASVNGFFRELPPVDASQSSDLLLHRFENTPGSENLREGHKLSARYGLIHYVHDILPAYRLLGTLLDDPNANLVQLAHGLKEGQGFFDLLEKEKWRGTNFNKFMTSIQVLSAPVAVDFDWGSHCECIVDIGGGKGHLLLDLLNVHPSIRHGVLVELPSVIEEAETFIDPKFRSKVTLIKDSFFNEPTNTTNYCGNELNTCYVMRNILHDWNDRDSLRILSFLSARMRSKKDKLVIVELIPEEFVNPDIPSTIAIDAIMLTITGQERTIGQFNRLFQQTGFDQMTVYPTRSIFKIGIARKN